MWTKRGIAHVLHYGLYLMAPPYGLLVVIFFFLTLFSIWWISKQTRARLESEKQECRIKTTFGQLSFERTNIFKEFPANFSAMRPVHSVQTVLVTCLKPCSLAMTEEISEVFEIRISFNQNLEWNTSAQSLNDNKRNNFNTEGLQVFSWLDPSIMQTYDSIVFKFHYAWWSEHI